MFLRSSSSEMPSCTAASQPCLPVSPWHLCPPCLLGARCWQGRPPTPLLPPPLHLPLPCASSLVPVRKQGRRPPDRFRPTWAKPLLLLGTPWKYTFYAIHGLASLLLPCPQVVCIGGETNSVHVLPLPPPLAPLLQFLQEREASLPLNSGSLDSDGLRNCNPSHRAVQPSPCCRLSAHWAFRFLILKRNEDTPICHPPTYSSCHTF